MLTRSGSICVDGCADESEDRETRTMVGKVGRVGQGQSVKTLFRKAPKCLSVAQLENI